MKNLLLILASVFVTAAAAAQAPICAATVDCRCKVELYINTQNPGYGYRLPDCVESIDVIQPTALNFGCCFGFNHPNCTIERNCTYTIGATVTLKSDGGCSYHEWSWHNSSCHDEDASQTVYGNGDIKSCGSSASQNTLIYY